MSETTSLSPAQMVQASIKAGPYVSGTTYMSLAITQRPIPMLPPPSKKRKTDEGDEQGGESKRTRSTGDAGLHPGIKMGAKRGAGSGPAVSLRTLVEKGFLQAGRDNLSVNYKGTTFTAGLEKDGSITFEGETFNSASAFSVHAKRKLTPHKQGDDGWKSVYYSGKQLDEFRRMYNEQYNPQAMAPLPPRHPSGSSSAPRPPSSSQLAADSPGGARLQATQQLAPQPRASQRTIMRSAIFGSETEEDEDEDETEDEDDAFLRPQQQHSGGVLAQTPSPAAMVAAAAKPGGIARQPASSYKPAKPRQSASPAAGAASGSKRPGGSKAGAGVPKAKKAGAGAKQQAAAAAAREVVVSQQMLAQAAAANVEIETDQWVQCSHCDEWRSVPNSSWAQIQAADDDDDWFCEDATWDVTKFKPFTKPCKKAGAKKAGGRS